MITTTSETMPTTEAVLVGLKAGEDWATEFISWMAVLDNKLLAAAVRGELDLNQIARVILAQRGFNADPTPVWVGFAKAERELLGA